MTSTVFVGKRRKLTLSAVKLARQVQKRDGFESGSARTSGIRLVQLALAAKIAAKDALRTFPPASKSENKRFDVLLGILTDAAQSLSAIDVSKDSAKRYYSESIAASLARACAVGIHARLHRAFVQGTAARKGGTPNSVRKRLRARERVLRTALVALNRAARNGSAKRVAEVLGEIARDAHQVLPELMRDAARASLGKKRKDFVLGLQASMLARRTAMIAAASVQLHRRLILDRLMKNTQVAVKKIKKLRRDSVRPETARTFLTALDASHRRAIVGRVTAAEWLERPKKPFTRITLAGMTTEVHVPHRSLERRGVESGTVIWAMGTVKRGKPDYLETEFEGPGQHQSRYFEDFLATLARPAYDLYPGTVLLEWEFPRLKTGRGANDLLGRVI